MTHNPYIWLIICKCFATYGSLVVRKPNQIVSDYDSYTHILYDVEKCKQLNPERFVLGENAKKVIWLFTIILYKLLFSETIEY